jgi:dTDP-4-amino-4,6-dideoxygalactose transaminase
MHYAGFPCDMDEIVRMAQLHGLKIVEDACHGPLSEYNGRKLGTIGDIGCFSFFSNKNISTGEGGLLVTNQEPLASRVALLRSHGMTSLSYQRHKGHETLYDVVDLGYNYRMDDVRASLGLAQLSKLPADLRKRAAIRRWYLECMEKVPGIVIPFKSHEGFVSNYIFPVVLAEADADFRHSVRLRLKEYGVQTSVHYPAVHKFSIYDRPPVCLPVTEYVSNAEITLPMYSALEPEDVEYVCTALMKALNHN